MHVRESFSALIVAAILALPFVIYFWSLKP